jgi:hypothetical protein
MGSRRMQLSEESIKSLQAQANTLKQGKDHSFVIWFADGNVARNTAVFARATQGIRRVFMTEFGSKIADRVRAAIPA